MTQLKPSTSNQHEQIKGLIRFKAHHLNQLISMIIKLQQEVNQMSQHLSDGMVELMKWSPQFKNLFKKYYYLFSQK